jgi:hypothetical protein
MSALATKEQLLSFGRNRRFLEEDVPGLGRVRFRSLTERERSEYELSIYTSTGKPSPERMLSARLRLLAATLCDHEGNLLFGSGDELLQVAGNDGRGWNDLYELAAKHVGIKSGETEDLVKKSETTPAAS